jgi:glycosyltransferase involved in cell wall biosynthesis
LVPVDDPEALAGKILEVLDHEEQSKEMAMKGKQWVLKNATLEPMVQNFINLYQSLIPQ